MNQLLFTKNILLKTFNMLKEKSIKNIEEINEQKIKDIEKKEIVIP